MAFHPPRPDAPLRLTDPDRNILFLIAAGILAPVFPVFSTTCGLLLLAAYRIVRRPRGRAALERILMWLAPSYRRAISSWRRECARHDLAFHTALGYLRGRVDEHAVPIDRDLIATFAVPCDAALDDVSHQSRRLDADAAWSALRDTGLAPERIAFVFTVAYMASFTRATAATAPICEAALAFLRTSGLTLPAIPGLAHAPIDAAAMLRRLQALVPQHSRPNEFGLVAGMTAVEIGAARRAYARAHHPDATGRGDSTAMARANAAFDAALSSLRTARSRP